MAIGGLFSGESMFHRVSNASKVALVALVPMVNALGRAGFAWVASGGLLYTVGIVFYALDARLAHAPRAPCPLRWRRS